MIAACPHWLVATGQFLGTIAIIAGLTGTFALILIRMGFE